MSVYSDLDLIQHAVAALNHTVVILGPDLTVTLNELLPHAAQDFFDSKF